MDGESRHSDVAPGVVDFVFEAEYASDGADTDTFAYPDNPWIIPPPGGLTSAGVVVWNVTFGNASNASDANVTSAVGTPPSLNWGVLALTALIVATAIGNILVCLAVCWEKRLQNMTNYFLMSLAIADLLVSLLVMPLGMVVELYGQ